MAGEQRWVMSDKGLGRGRNMGHRRLLKWFFRDIRGLQLAPHSCTIAHSCLFAHQIKIQTQIIYTVRHWVGKAASIGLYIYLCCQTAVKLNSVFIYFGKNWTFCHDQWPVFTDLVNDNNGPVRISDIYSLGIMRHMCLQPIWSMQMTDQCINCTTKLYTVHVEK